MGDLAEGCALCAALTLDALEVCRLGGVLGHELRGSYVGGTFVVGALGDAPAMPAPTSVGIALKPRGADAALDLASVVSELGLIERLAPVLADNDVGCWIRC